MNNLSNTVAGGFINSYRDFAGRVHALAAQLSEEQFWIRPYDYGNSFGHLTLHLIGNLNYYIGTQIAGTGYVRDREREFTETNFPSKEDVLRQLDEAVELVIATLREQTADTWANEYEAVGVSDFIKDRFGIFLRCAAHFHHHIGQMIYLVKELSTHAGNRQPE
ncbi:MAG TPA: DinB family protein [Blastocatellia bacterium]|nr:DinB family protein [Blastocatellia bacterium]